MHKSEQNAIDLQKAFDESPFDDLKVFVPPDTKTSAEAVTASVLKAMPHLVALYNGDKKPEYSL